MKIHQLFLFFMNYIIPTIEYVKKELRHAEAGHDWFHIERVYKNALLILESETADRDVVLLAALLHDIADSKFHEGDESIGPKKAHAFMECLGIDTQTIQHVVAIIGNVSFKGGHFEKHFHSKELDIVQDADRLDAIGAIGIARAFHYGGYKNRILFDPETAPKMHMTKEEYKTNEGTTINHFYEKLLKLKDLMNTETGKKIAQKRHLFMQSFLSEFYAEWDGEA